MFVGCVLDCLPVGAGLGCFVFTLVTLCALIIDVFGVLWVCVYAWLWFLEFAELRGRCIAVMNAEGGFGLLFLICLFCLFVCFLDWWVCFSLATTR